MGSVFGMIEEERKEFDIKRNIFEWVESVVISVVILAFVFTFLFRIVGVSGKSMQHTLEDQDRIVISTLFYTPKYGDIVVVNQPNEFHKPLVKRIIATENQTIDIDFETATVTVDGKVLDEPYLSTPTTDSEGLSFPLTVPEGHVFIMGDNRQDSTDSRSNLVGMIDTQYILGRALVRIFPFNKIGLLA